MISVIEEKKKPEATIIINNTLELSVKQCETKFEKIVSLKYQNSSKSNQGKSSTKDKMNKKSPNEKEKLKSSKIKTDPPKSRIKLHQNLNTKGRQRVDYTRVKYTYNNKECGKKKVHNFYKDGKAYSKGPTGWSYKFNNKAISNETTNELITIVWKEYSISPKYSQPQNGKGTKINITEYKDERYFSKVCNYCSQIGHILKECTLTRRNKPKKIGVDS